MLISPTDFDFQPNAENLDNQEPWPMTTLIPETEDVMDDVICADGNKLILHYLKDVKSVLQVHDLETGKFLHSIPLDIGQVSH